MTAQRNEPSDEARRDKRISADAIALLAVSGVGPTAFRGLDGRRVIGQPGSLRAVGVESIPRAARFLGGRVLGAYGALRTDGAVPVIRFSGMRFG